MNGGTLFAVMMEHERRTNRSCTVAALWAAAVCALICLVGTTGAYGLSPKWMGFYAAVDIVPILAIADCIAKCKKRADEDPEFAALVERDPEAAVKEVQT